MANPTDISKLETQLNKCHGQFRFQRHDRQKEAKLTKLKLAKSGFMNKFQQEKRLKNASSSNLMELIWFDRQSQKEEKKTLHFRLLSEMKFCTIRCIFKSTKKPTKRNCYLEQRPFHLCKNVSVDTK